MEIQLVITILLFIFVASLIKKSSKKKGTNNVKIPYEETPENKIDYIDLKNAPYKLKYLLTKNEYSFYKELKKIADKNTWLICPKVGMKDLFDITNKESYMKWFGKIAQKHIDFLICDDMLRPKFAIELDDNSHKSDEKKESDRFKDILFLKNDIILHRIKAQVEYSEEYILRNINLIQEKSVPKNTV